MPIVEEELWKTERKELFPPLHFIQNGDKRYVYPMDLIANLACRYSEGNSFSEIIFMFKKLKLVYPKNSWEIRNSYLKIDMFFISNLLRTS